MAHRQETGRSCSAKGVLYLWGTDAICEQAKDQESAYQATYEGLRSVDKDGTQVLVGHHRQ
jgi:hypothetical protein